MPALRKTLDQKREIAIKQLFMKGLINKGWTQQHLVKLLNLSPCTVSVAFNHPLERNFRTLLVIADKLGVNLGEALLESR